MIHTRFNPLPHLWALIALLLAGQAMALEIQDLTYDRAFSPNGDGSQDFCEIKFTVNGESQAVRGVTLAVFSLGPVPPVGEALAVLMDSTETGDATAIDYAYSWSGRDEDGAILADGFYYLHIFAETENSTLWLEPSIQLEINTVPPRIHSVASEPADFFTPLQASTGADSIVQLFFNAVNAGDSIGFDPLTDTALATIYRRDPLGGPDVDIQVVQRDPDYRVDLGEISRYRLLWDGRDRDGELVDGLYRAAIQLSDDAGNPSPPAADITINLDILAPGLTVHWFGEEAAMLSTFYFQSALLPDSLVVSAADRNGSPVCRAIVGNPPTGIEIAEGEWLPTSTEEEDYFSFQLPDAWYEVADTTYQFYLDATDTAGNRAGEFESTLSITLNLDNQAPARPQWDTAPQEVIQAAFELTGRCEQSGLTVHIYEDGDSIRSINVDPAGAFSVPILLRTGTHVWTAVAEDRASNRSAISAELPITYTPGAALSMPGRFRGGLGETIGINTAVDAESITLRFYSLEGDLVSRVEALGGPREFRADWDLTDEDGNDLLDGLYVVNVATRLSSGQWEFERKVVAIVRD